MVSERKENIRLYLLITKQGLTLGVQYKFERSA